MKVHLNEMTVYRNTAFTIDKIIKARDGAPYIVSSQLENPYICITITSSKYTQMGRYERTWWLDQANGYNINGDLVVPLVRFNSTSPMPLPGNNWSSPLPVDPSTGQQYDPYEALWYITLSNGVKEYKRWSVENDAWVDYEFRIIKTFTHNDTKEWVDQEYLYDIVLVAGNTLLEYLEEVKVHVFMEQHNLIELDVLDENSPNYDSDLAALWNIIPTDVTGIYLWLKGIDINYVKGLDVTVPLINYSTVETILEPTKLTVLSYLRGGL